jgi:hypothetical protein
MSEQDLNCSKVGSSLEQLSCEGMTKTMRRNALADLGSLDCFT